MGEELEDYRVQFVSEHAIPRTVEPGTIIIAPSSSNWNDFGARILIDIFIQSQRNAKSESERLELPGFFGFIEKHSGQDDTLHLRAIVSQDSTPTPAKNIPAFFTMLRDMESYRQIVRRLGPDEARLALRAIKDMVEADDSPLGKAWLPAARKSEIFLNAFLRLSGSYFTWKNAAPILRGIEYEKLDRISDEFRIRFQLAGRPNEHDLKFRFSPRDAVLPQRVAIVIGKNGVGKSQALTQIVDAALLGTANLTDSAGDRPQFNRILGFYPSAASSSAFPSERRKRVRVWYRRFAMAGGRGGRTTSDLIIQLARSTESIAGQSRFDIFLSAITAIDDYRELVLRVKPGERGPIAIHGLTRGGEQETIRRYAAINGGVEPVRLIGRRTYPLSSGELSFLRFAALAGLYIENGSLLLFDEPETHLHPNFISQFVGLLDRLLDQTGSAAILSTHSVYFVREVAEDQVTVLRSSADRMISAETPTLKTFGADVGAISYFVFGEDKPSRLALEVETRIIEQTTSWEEIFRQYKDRISLDLLGEIRAQVEDRDTDHSGK